ncbi:MAG: serine/threonine-protein phosphatase, partial [Desulfobacteraceae bacterium]|nr:serine/threonine-protein phosphatase [Desulfobacteraceae bacterium]
KNNDEVGRLAESFIFMQKELKQNIRELIKTTAVNERIEGELNIAREIQLGILPKVFPPFPDQKEIDIYASIEPAKEIGGDLYDFYYIDKDKFCFTIGDVSDKGVPAALMMVITKTLIKSAASKYSSPADIMIEVNNAIEDDNPRTMFVTLFIGILDIKTGKVTYSNGGHNPPILIKNNGDTEYLKKISGPVVGAVGGIQYKELSIDLKPGDALFMYTDGVTEAMNSEEQFYTDQRLINEITKMAPESSKDTVKGIKSDIKSFVGKASQYDDIAMLMLKYTGSK